MIRRDHVGYLGEQALVAARLAGELALARRVSHDLTNYVGAALMWCTLLRESGEVSGLPPDLTMVEASVRRVADLGAALGRFGAEPSRLPVPVSVARSVDASLAGLPPRPAIRFKTDLPADLPEALVVSDGLVLALGGLIENAIDVTPDGGTVAVRAREDGPWLRIEVRDKGPGMDERALANLGEPLFTTKPKDEHWGLGLARAHAFALHSGGRMEVESAPDGTTISLVVPRALELATVLAEGEPPEPAAGAASVAPAGTVAILLVDDYRPLRLAAEDILRSAGYVVYAVADPDEALRLVDEQPGRIDILATDLGLPGMTGWELASRIRGRRPGIRILYISGTEEVRSIPDEGQGSAFLAKPYTAAQLRAIVGELVRVSALAEPSPA